MKESRQHRTLTISTESPSMSARIHEKLKAFYGDTLCLRLLELIPAAAVPASFVCHACLTYEEPREVFAVVLVPCIFWSYLLFVIVFSRIAVVRFTAILLYVIHAGYRLLFPVDKHFPGDPLDWKYVLFHVLMIAGLAIIAARERSFFKLRIYSEPRGYVGTLDAPSSIFLLIFLIGFVFYLFS